MTFIDGAGNLELLVSAPTAVLLESSQQTDEGSEENGSGMDTRLDCLMLHIRHDAEGNVTQRSRASGVDPDGVPHRMINIFLPRRMSWVTVVPKPFAAESGLSYAFTSEWDDPETEDNESAMEVADADTSLEGLQVSLPTRVTRFTLTVSETADPDNSTVYEVQIVLPAIQHAPEFTAGASITLSVDENTGGPANVGASLAATDENLPKFVDDVLQNVETAVSNEELTYSIVGVNQNFSIHYSTGQIRTRRSLNYELGNTTYSFRARVTDISGRSDTINVTVNVNNLDEPGRVSVSSGQLLVGSQVSASLHDPDGG